MGDNIEAWRENNPEGYARALEETVEEHIYAKNAQRFDNGQPAMSKEEKAFTKASLPDSPDEIQKRTYGIVQGLSKEAIEYRDDMVMISDNLNVANQLIEDRDIFDESAPRKAKGLVKSSEKLAEKYNANMNDIIDQYDIKVGNQILEDISPETIHSVTKDDLVPISQNLRMNNDDREQNLAITTASPALQFDV